MLPFVSGVKSRAASFEELARSSAKRLDSSVDLEVLTAALNIVRVSSLLVNDLEARAHRPAGWTWAGFRVMFVVFIAEAAEPREVARLAGVSRASVSGVLKTLERDGLIVRERSSPDRRVVTVKLTRRGRRATVQAFKHNHQVERRWLAGLSRAELRTVIALLHRLRSPYREAAELRRPVGSASSPAPARRRRAPSASATHG